MDENKSVELGKTGIRISKLGIGTWQWGDRFYWKYTGADLVTKDIRSAFDSCISNEINFFDTAEVYGLGRSERILSTLIKSTDKKIILATKFMPFPWRLFKWNLRFALKNSLKRLRLGSVDLYQIHFPLPPIPLRFWLEELASAHKDGLINAAGISNFDINQTSLAQKVLEDHGLPLASNQVQFSLIHREIEKNGLLNYCREQHITILAYSPLGQGMLTGKYTSNNPPPGLRARRYNRHFLKKIQPLLSLMREIGDQREKTLPQIALNWVICKGAVPIPGAKNASQAKENMGALGWQLNPDEILALDQASEKIYV